MTVQNYQQELERLKRQVKELEHSEKLQHALFSIVSLAQKEMAIEQMYVEVHQIVNTVLNASNLFIALLNDDQASMRVVYFVDEKDSEEKDITGNNLPIGEGLTSYVIKKRTPQLLSPDDINALIAQGEIKEVLGSSEFYSWMGAPMISGESFHGVIVVQSYEKGFRYREKDLQVLEFVATQIAAVIESHVNAMQRRDAQNRLAEQHRLLAQQNDKLNQTIDHLKKTQDELVQREKMASLGGLVAGIAHEINTPLGICVTGISHIMEEYKYIKQSLEKQTLSEDELLDFFKDLEQGLKILESNTFRGAQLVKSFKQVAVDQSSNEVREINLVDYIDEILLSLKPKLKRVAHEIIVDCPNDIRMDINAGALSQILSNLIMNSLIHGFEEIDKGRIQIKIQEKDKVVNLHYADDGKGVAPEQLVTLFEPFFTTKRGAGGSGLGTHLVYNLVQSLNGKIKVKSELNKGLAYLIVLPKTAE